MGKEIECVLKGSFIMARPLGCHPFGKEDDQVGKRYANVDVIMQSVRRGRGCPYLPSLSNVRGLMKVEEMI